MPEHTRLIANGMALQNRTFANRSEMALESHVPSRYLPMRRTSRLSSSTQAFGPPPEPARIHGWQTLGRLLPYLLPHRWRMLFSLLCLVAAKVSTVSAPIVFKSMIDDLSVTNGTVVLPILLLLLYGALRFGNSLFTELREILFARVTQEAVRHISLEVFRHLHSLSLRFHLERQTGGLSRDMERGSRSVSSLITYTLYSILPTLVEISLVLGILIVEYDIAFVLITIASLVVYIAFTVTVSNWRIDIRRKVNEADSTANALAIDSLLNYETVKYFNNEAYEARAYGAQLSQWAEASTKSQISLSWLNLGQQIIITVGVTAMMWRAAAGVIAGQMSIGDLVLVNAFLIQLYMPLNFLGVIYREIRQALADIERMFGLLGEHREIVDIPGALTLNATSVDIRFEAVDFSYETTRQILFDVDFAVPAGKTVAVVGPSGSGKSTLARLLYRFYDVNRGSILVGGHDVRALTQTSLRAAIAVVPQDTVLLNDTILHNIRYGRPDAGHEEIIAAAEAAQLDAFIARLPNGYETRVGERGLKLSGGEKQRIAIARALLKNPPLLIFDEATSSLDSRTEKAIQASIDRASRGRTTLMIAHRLSTVMNADLILVMDNGRIVERGTHAELMEMSGRYAQMWALQQQENEAQSDEGS